MEVGEANLGGRGVPGVQGLPGQGGELLGGVLPEQLRKQRREVPFERDLPRIAAAFELEGGTHHARDLLERLVLQEPREQEVAGFQQGNVALILDFAGGQQPGRLEVEQGRGDDEEFAGFIKGPFLAQVLQTLDVLDELIGDGGQRHLRDVQLVLGDQAQEEVEGAGEVGQPDLETGLLPGRRKLRRRGGCRCHGPD